MLIGFLRLFLRLFFDRKHFPPKSAGFRALRPWLRALWFQKVLMFNRRCPWPIAATAMVSDYRRIHFPAGEVHNFQSPGTYFQNFAADIFLGSKVYIGPNVGLITANHDPRNPDKHLQGEPIRLEDGTWVGMGSIVLPGVTLGPGTVVAAGSTVTRSFPEGNLLLAGTPARIIKTYDA